MSGPVSRALTGSYLSDEIRGGIQALPSEKRKHIAESVRSDFVDSLDLDEASRPRHPTDARWDYLLGHAPSSQIVAVETHSAETSQVSRVIQKRTASLGHLRGQLRAGHHVAAWYWAASGRVDFVPHEKTVIRLSEHGIQFVGGRLEAKHLAKLSKGSTAPYHQRAKPRR
ncbi:MAG TPA: hypothetical protein VF469_36055 [Kofleriaceae bacterium]